MPGLVGGLWVLGALVAKADYRTDVGYDALQAELGAALPKGIGIGVSQIEAVDGAGSLPDSNHPEFVGKTINITPGASGVSSHATTVGQYFYGSVTSLSPGITQIDAYEANLWLNEGFLNLGGNVAPAIESRAVTNHSWIGAYEGEFAVLNQEALRRFDFAIQRDDFVAVVALNNGGAVPELLASSYNGIVVGLSGWPASYSPGTTVLDGIGRGKPDIVAPQGFTSFATPVVASAASMLLEKAVGTLADAQKSVAMKAILMAGATKSQFPSWDRTATRPLDETYGAGQLNVYRSYRVLVAGPQAASTSVSVRRRGWDYRITTGSQYYFFDIAAGDSIPDFSAVLTWNRIIADGVNGQNWGNPTANLPDLSLKLYAASAFTVGTLVDSSVSTVDNVEHIYAPNLPPGRYALEVTSNQSGVSYGLAWNSVPTVSVAETTPTASEQGLVPGVFTISRAGETIDALTVNFTISGTATNGVDYQSIAGSVTIPVGLASATVTITPLPDNLAEGAETVTLTLASHPGYAVGAASSATGSLSDQPSLSDPPFEAWRFSEFTSAEFADPEISGAEADPDHDGLKNLTEYALQSPPKTPSLQNLPVAARNLSGALTLSYTLLKAATDITCVPEISTDLVNWHAGAGYVSVQSIDQGSTLSVVATSVLPPATEPRQFMRLKVTQP